MDNFRYDIRWSDSLDEKFIVDYLSLQNEVFNCGTREEFEKQFFQNIYGKSLLVVVYSGEEPVAARALWRNDVDGREAYQPGSVCVKKIYRGKGIFTLMTQKAIALLPSDSVIYTFPNINSLSGYKKMGWCIYGAYKARLYLSYTKYSKEHPVQIDDEYVNWWLKGKSLWCKKIGQRYFLLQKDKRPLCYHILGEIGKKSASLFPMLIFGFIFYKSQKNTWYNKKLGSSCLVTRNYDIDMIPTWKIDAV